MKLIIAALALASLFSACSKTSSTGAAATGGSGGSGGGAAAYSLCTTPTAGSVESSGVGTCPGAAGTWILYQITENGVGTITSNNKYCGRPTSDTPGDQTVYDTRFVHAGTSTSGNDYHLETDCASGTSNVNAGGKITNIFQLQ